MQLGLREWWQSKRGGDKLVWVIAVVALLLYFTGQLPEPRP